MASRAIDQQLTERLVAHFQKRTPIREFPKVVPDFNNASLLHVQEQLRLPKVILDSLFWICGYVKIVREHFQNSIGDGMKTMARDKKYLQQLKNVDLSKETRFVMKVKVQGKTKSIAITDIYLRESLCETIRKFLDNESIIFLRATDYRHEAKFTSILCASISDYFFDLYRSTDGDKVKSNAFLVTGYAMICSGWPIFTNTNESKITGYPVKRKPSILAFDTKFKKNLIDKVRNRAGTVKRRHT